MPRVPPATNRAGNKVRAVGLTYGVRTPRNNPDKAAESEEAGGPDTP